MPDKYTSLKNKLALIGYSCSEEAGFIIAKRVKHNEVNTYVYCVYDGTNLHDIADKLEGNVIITGNGKIKEFGFVDIEEYGVYPNEKIKELVIDIDTSDIKHLKYGFSYLRKLRNIEFKRFDTSHIHNMAYLFKGCRSLTQISLKSLNLDAVTTLNGAFSQCVSLRSFDISGTDLSNLIYMRAMFEACTSLIEVDMTNTNLSNIMNIERCFRDCRKLVTLHIDGLKLPPHCYHDLIFDNCDKLETTLFNKTEQSI